MENALPTPRNLEELFRLSLSKSFTLYFLSAHSRPGVHRSWRFSGNKNYLALAFWWGRQTINKHMESGDSGGDKGSTAK